MLQQRNEWADIEFRASKRTIHVTNGDRSSAASFHKTLPHDRLGQVRSPLDKKIFTPCSLAGQIHNDLRNVIRSWKEAAPRNI